MKFISRIKRKYLEWKFNRASSEHTVIQHMETINENLEIFWEVSDTGYYLHGWKTIPISEKEKNNILKGAHNKDYTNQGDNK